MVFRNAGVSPVLFLLSARFKNAGETPALRKPAYRGPCGFVHAARSSPGALGRRLNTLGKNLGFPPMLWR